MGRTAVVTGGTDGIGAATVRQLRQRGADVIAIGRSQAKADALRADDADAGSGGLAVRTADLGLMRNVNRVVATLGVDRIDLLVHAVGVLIPRAEHTSEGPEKDFAVSYLGRYQFVEEAARRAGAARVRPPDRSLTRPIRHHGDRVRPGAVDTNIRREIPAVVRALLKPFHAAVTRRPDQAAADIVAALADPAVAPQTATFRDRKGAFTPDPYVLDARRQADLMSSSDALVTRALS